MKEFACQHWLSPLGRFVEHVKNRVCRRRTAGQVHIVLHHATHRAWIERAGEFGIAGHFEQLLD